MDTSRQLQECGHLIADAVLEESYNFETARQAVRDDISRNLLDRAAGVIQERKKKARKKGDHSIQSDPFESEVLFYAVAVDMPSEVLPPSAHEETLLAQRARITRLPS